MSQASQVRARVVAAAREFNRGNFADAHGQLEDGLDEVPDGEWSLFVGLVQIASGYHRLQQGLLDGGARMLELGLEKVEPYAADAADLDLGAFRARARRDLAALRAGSFDPATLRRSPPRLTPLKEGARRRPGKGAAC